MSMKIRRKFNLQRIGLQYESIDIEVEGDNIGDIIYEIDDIWEKYSRLIADGKVS